MVNIHGLNNSAINYLKNNSLKNNFKFGVYSSLKSRAFKKREIKVAEQLGLEVLANPNDADFVILLDEKINLKCNHSLYSYNETKKPLPIYCDFLTHYKILKTKDRSESPAFLAVKMNKIDFKNSYILDATGGIGLDAFFFAYMGMNVVILERDPMIFTLLQDGYHRGMQFDGLKDILERMNIINISMEEYLENLGDSSKPNVIFLDPTYPSTKGKFSPFIKTTLRIIRFLVGPSSSTSSLLDISKKYAIEKVVLKLRLGDKAIETDGIIKVFKSRTESFYVYETTTSSKQQSQSETNNEETKRIDCY